MKEMYCSWHLIPNQVKQLQKAAFLTSGSTVLNSGWYSQLPLLWLLRDSRVYYTVLPQLFNSAVKERDIFIPWNNLSYQLLL